VQSGFPRWTCFEGYLCALRSTATLFLLHAPKCLSGGQLKYPGASVQSTRTHQMVYSLAASIEKLDSRSPTSSKKLSNLRVPLRKRQHDGFCPSLTRWRRFQPRPFCTTVGSYRICCCPLGFPPQSHARAPWQCVLRHALKLRGPGRELSKKAVTVTTSVDLVKKKNVSLWYW